MLSLRTIEPHTLELLKALMQEPALCDLRLVGGTALALQYGHRSSIDLDLFGKFDPQKSMRVFLLQNGHVANGAENGEVQSLTVDGVKVDFVNYPYPWLQDCVEEENFRLAGLKDITAMKLSAAANRGRKKDFIDIEDSGLIFPLESSIILFASSVLSANSTPAYKSSVFSLTTTKSISENLDFTPT